MYISDESVRVLDEKVKAAGESKGYKVKRLDIIPGLLMYVFSVIDINDKEVCVDSIINLDTFKHFRGSDDDFVDLFLENVDYKMSKVKRKE